MELIAEKKFRVDTLGLSATGFWRLKKAGDLPVPIVIGRRNYYTTESIMDWLASKKGKKSHEIGELSATSSLGGFESKSIDPLPQAGMAKLE